MLKLNLGCGQNRRAGYVNIDKYPTFTPDLLWDLEQTPWPFEAASVQEIAAHHVLEHLGQQPDVFLAIIQELYRILVPGGIVDIKVPHHRSDGYWNDPTHVRPINPQLLGLFSKRACRMFAERGWPNTPLADYLDVDFEIERVQMTPIPPWGERFHSGTMTQDEIDFAIRTHWNVIDEVAMVMRKL